MIPAEIVIGIDLDNTLVCYDELFHLTACQEQLIEPSVPKCKEMIRDRIRLLPDGEQKWIRLQAVVYGTRMSGATLFEGADVFLRHCSQWRTPVKIVSHKTPFAMLDGRRLDLRQPARAWLQEKNSSLKLGLSLSDVFFESTRAEKIERIRSLGCSHFIDDLWEVFAENLFPKTTQKLLFAPHGTASTEPGAQVFTHWRELDRFFFHDRRA